MRKERLIFVDLRENHNKYWNGIQKDEWVTTEWGRVGDPPQTKTWTFGSQIVAEREFDKRLKEKLKHGYTRQLTVDDEYKPTGYVAKVQIEHNNDAETKNLIDFLVTRNIHAIEGMTNIRVQGGGLTTPLGPVTLEGLDEAQAILGRMASGANMDECANAYLRIVPRNIGRNRIDGKSLFGQPTQLQTELVTIDTLRAVIKDMTDKATGTPVIFETKLKLISGGKEFDRVNGYFLGNMNRNHTSYGKKLVRLWEMHIAKAEQTFTNIGNVKELWHGTSDANLLSILKTSYKVPGRNGGIKITGRMFGDGLYFSDQSTKSLNYATGFWGGGSHRLFMLLNDVSLGKEYHPQRAFSGLPPRGYDSTMVRGGTAGVRNNEFVVYNLGQIRPTYLCEFA